MRTAAVIELAPTPRHQFQFATWLFPSWLLFAWQPGRVTVDLVVFCEHRACDSLPTECRATLTAPSNHSTPRCVSVRMPAPFAAGQYPFATSVDFLVSPEFASLLAYTRPRYDYVLRADADSVFGPSTAHWLPPKAAAFGKGFMGVNATLNTLEELSRSYGLRQQHIHGMQSTIYLHRRLVAPFATLLVNLTERVYREEFTPLKCRARLCQWPEWHRGVSSLYAQDLAVNHFIPAAHAADVVTGRLDYGATGLHAEFSQVVMAHLLSVKHLPEFSSAGEVRCKAAAGGRVDAKGSRAKWFDRSPPMSWPDIVYWLYYMRSREACAILQKWAPLQ
ncbi:hypothetical protein AB1Y20_013516 [Prymnesium parvum]|uniref:DUF7164 domain-containing protein n=1 Tax=Prymnesium parvum TaxID=97485 RepID=A0AB34IHQ2_PRYPA